MLFISNRVTAGYETNLSPHCCELSDFFGLLSSSRLGWYFDIITFQVIHLKKKKCLEPLNELWNIWRLSPFRLSSVFTLALRNCPWITSAKPVTSRLGDKKKDAFKVPFSKKERLCSLHLSASFISEWAEVRKCVNSCCGFFPWESDLPLFQELYCDWPEWRPNANELLGYKQRVGEVFLFSVSAVLAVIFISVLPEHIDYKLGQSPFFTSSHAIRQRSKPAVVAKVFLTTRKQIRQPNSRFSGYLLQVSTLHTIAKAFSSF